MRAKPSSQIRTLDDLGVPPNVLDFVNSGTGGIIFFSGMSGTGKSTTLSAVANYINDTQAVNITAIQNQMEFTYQNNKSNFVQKEFSYDYVGLANEIEETILSRSSDVIIVDESDRTAKTLWMAIQAAKTGHLVLVSTWGDTPIKPIEYIVRAKGNSEDYAGIVSEFLSIPSLVVHHTVGYRSGAISYDVLSPTREIVEAILKASPHWA